MLHILKPTLIILFLALSVSISVLAQNEAETVKPTFEVTVWRECTYIEIDDKSYWNVSFEITSKKNYKIGVSVLVINKNGQKIYEKKFKNSYLYVFSDNSVQIGKGNAITQVSIWKSKDDGVWKAIIRERGIY